MLKRFIAVFCSCLVVFSFCYGIAVRSAVSAAEAGSDGGGSHRGDYIDLSRAEVSPDSDDPDAFKNFLDDCFDSTSGDDLGSTLDNIFLCAVGSIGAIFSDETTVKGCINQFKAIYGNSVADYDTMRKIFYIGKDGQLYFTDEFIETTKNIVDQASFENGVFSVPFCTSDLVYQKALSFGILYLTNNVASCLSGDDSRLMNCCYSTAYKYFNDGFSITGLYPVLTFNDYSSYLAFCNGRVSSVPTFFYKYNNDGPVLLSLPESIFPWSSVPDSNGNFNRVNHSPFNFNEGQSKFLTSNPGSDDSSPFCFFAGVGTFEAYRSSDWLDFYMSGGTGVLRGNTYYKLDNAVNPDEVANGSAIYKQLQEHYKTLAGEVKAGTKTLSEINQILSDEILDTAKDIEQNTAVQANYLKKILNEVKDISKKLTYSNVVGTVNAATNLLSAIGDALDGLFESSEGTFKLLDFVQDGLSDTMRSVFPFSLPHDLLLIYEILAVDPKIPQVDFHFELARLGIKYDYTYVADDFTKLAYITRFFSSVGFVILLINLTNKMLKK